MRLRDDHALKLKIIVSYFYIGKVVERLKRFESVNRRIDIIHVDKLI